MSYTAKLAAFISDAKFAAFDPEIIEKAKLAFMDWIGVTLAGVNEDVGRTIMCFVANQAKDGKASVIGTSVKTSASDAALAMGTLSHALDFDDIYWPMIGHPSVTILPAVFALGEEYKISGQEAIEAFVVGFEVEALLGEVLSAHHYHQGWHTTSTLGPFGAAASCAKILDLNQKQIRNALGIAASHASGLRCNFGTMTKPLHAGNAARGGVVAAQLADMGFTADEDILEAEKGFASVFCGKGDRYELRGLMNPGEKWALLCKGRTTKKYPSCGATSVFIDCMLDICREHTINASEIEQIDCLINPKVTNILVKKGSPKSGLEGKFNLPYCLAVAALDGEVGLDQFTDKRVLSSDVQDLLNKVNLIEHDFERIGEAVVKVKTPRGVYEKSSQFAKGTPENPMTYEETKAKFEMCAKRIISKDAVDSVIKKLAALDEVKSIKELIILCSP